MRRARARVRVRVAAVAAVAAAAVLPVVARASSTTAACDWTSFGHDSAHTFESTSPCSSLSSANAPTLVTKWFFHTNDAVTASPAVDADTLYVGAWDGTFYALDRATGQPRWTFDVNGVDDNTSDFGRIVSSATLRDVGGTKVVLFGGGATLFALDATSGALLASQDLDPNPGGPPHVAEVESSPVAVVRDGHTFVYVGLDVHNDRDVGRAGVVMLDVVHDANVGWQLVPVWKFDPETSQTYTGAPGLTQGAGEGFGCGGVWSSPALVPASVAHPSGLVVFGTSSCSYADDAKAAGENFLESVFAVDAADGTEAWQFRPSDDPHEASADFDFGASPNVFTDATGRLVVGNGRKSGDYYALDPATGAVLWKTVAATPGYAEDGFAIGGFIGTPAVRTAAGRAQSIVGATAIPIPLNWNQDDPAGQVDRATWAARALDPVTGAVQWQYRLGGPSYGHTAIANDVVLVPETFDFRFTVLAAASGVPLFTTPLAGPPSSTPVPAGRDVYLGVGTRTGEVEPLEALSGVYGFSLAG